MDFSVYFKSVLEQDRAAVVICDTEDKIIYMNPAAVKNYEKYGGAGIMGKSLLECHNDRSCGMIKKVKAWFAKSSDNNIVYTSYNAKQNKDVYMIALRDESGNLIGYYEKHEYRNRETAEMYCID